MTQARPAGDPGQADHVAEGEPVERPSRPRLTAYPETRSNTSDPTDPTYCRSPRLYGGRWRRCRSAKCSRLCKQLRAMRLAHADMELYRRRPGLRPTHWFTLKPAPGIPAQVLAAAIGDFLAALGRKLRIKPSYQWHLHFTGGGRPHAHCLLRLPAGVELTEETLAAVGNKMTAKFGTDDAPGGQKRYVFGPGGYWVGRLTYGPDADGNWIVQYVYKFIADDTDELVPQSFTGKTTSSSRDWYPPGETVDCLWADVVARWAAEKVQGRAARAPDTRVSAPEPTSTTEATSCTTLTAGSPSTSPSAAARYSASDVLAAAADLGVRSPQTLRESKKCLRVNDDWAVSRNTTGRRPKRFSS